MTEELFLIFGAAYFLIGIVSAQPVDDRAKRIANVIIGVVSLVAGVMVAFPGIAS